MTSLFKAPAPKDLARFGTRLARGLTATAQNALEVARFGGLRTDEQASPHEIVAEQPVYKLRRYFPETLGDRPVVLLVPPLMLTAEIYDIAPTASAVGVLHDLGVDPWVVDFGHPEDEPGGLQRDISDHVLAISDAIDRIQEITGRDVHLAGYSQGGMFAYQTAAYRRSQGIESLVTFGSPADLDAANPFGVPAWFPRRPVVDLLGQLPNLSIPGWVTRNGFQILSPTKSVRNRLEFLLQLHDREVLAPRERQRRFMQGEGWVAWPGPALAEFLRQFVAHNRMLRGGFVIGGRLSSLADISCPVLAFVGEVDEIAPTAMVRGIVRAAPRAEVYEATQRTGHFGLVAGSHAAGTTWPVVAGWIHWRSGQGMIPQEIGPVKDEEQGMRGKMGYGLELAVQVGSGAVRSAAGAVASAVHGLVGLGEEAAELLPRLRRLERIEPDTRMSFGLLLDEQARRNPDEVLFLYEDRAHTRAAAERRIDAVVRGLLSIGIRQGEHVGVLMSNRPSALALVAALSRLGAVAVMLRPDGDLPREIELGQVRRVVADPVHARLVEGAEVFLLGGSDRGPDPEAADHAAADLDRMDTDLVEVPGWYRPNPGRAGDLAFILFSGDGRHTKAIRITNRRWALSAFGTASSAALSPADTVYSLAPISHPSALLMSLGGAVAGGSRLALASGYDPATFWDEARRYGVTVASYTWTLLHGLVEAPPHPGERHHSVRLFIGSGMPRGLWRRLETRLAPARVLEFYASTEGEAIMVNLTGKKPGAVGRSLPGSAPVRIAKYDLERLELVPGSDGFAVECGPGETGILLAEGGTAPDLLRGVFAPGDSWITTGDLFQRDADGDHWMVGRTAEIARTAAGPVPCGIIRDRIGDVPGVDLAVAYAIPAGRHDLLAAAVTLRAPVTAADFTAAFPDRGPDLIRVVDEIDASPYARLLTTRLRTEAIPDQGTAYYRDASGSYRPLTPTARTRLRPQ
ncbi:AMP-binding protein [Actinocorallia sp. API 0066]|uniref:AMP-binding protein n=1 Tax=Actinocorallia sp. API 0066 TaxID=2896846 RepID=UPI001E60F84C|nr:AMP-binding protein [Actinocorallia sp. API 0066]MCD0448819.1 AMP-binding protein [Actinocorallia sp. API 0066]